MLLELILDFGKCSNQTTYESENAQFGHFTRSKIDSERIKKNILI